MMERSSKLIADNSKGGGPLMKAFSRSSLSMLLRKESMPKETQHSECKYLVDMKVTRDVLSRASYHAWVAGSNVSEFEN